MRENEQRVLCARERNVVQSLLFLAHVGLILVNDNNVVKLKTLDSMNSGDNEISVGFQVTNLALLVVALHESIANRVVPDFVIKDALLQAIEEGFLGDDGGLVLVDPSLDGRTRFSPPLACHLCQGLLSLGIAGGASCDDFLCKHVCGVCGIHSLDVRPVHLDERREERRCATAVRDHRDDRAAWEHLFQALLNSECFSAGESQERHLLTTTQAVLNIGGGVLGEQLR